MPKGRPRPLGDLNVNVLVEQLFALHRQADDPHLESFPAPEDVIGVLRYTGTRCNALQPQARRESARLRLSLTRYLHQQAESAALRSIKDARAADVTWAELAEVLGVDSKQGAQQYAQRLEAAATFGPDERRAPETLRRRMQEKTAETAWHTRHHAELRGVVERLLANREELLADEAVVEWLDELAVSAGNCHTATEQAALSALLRLAVREIDDLATRTGRPVAATAGAQEAFNAAAELKQLYHHRVAARVAGASGKSRGEGSPA
jgi:hypothetical protein